MVCVRESANASESESERWTDDGFIEVESVDNLILHRIDQVAYVAVANKQNESSAH